VASILQSNAGGHGTGTNTATTSGAGFGSTTTAGSLLILVGWASASQAGATKPTLSTPANLNGQAWTLAGSVQSWTQSGTDSGAVGIWYIANTSSFSIAQTTTLTAALTSASLTVEFSLYEVSGIVITSPIDGTPVGNSNSTGSSSTINAGTLTTTLTDFIFSAEHSSSSASVGSGFTLGIRNVYANYGASQYNLAVASGSVPTAFGSSSAYWAAASVAFKLLPDATAYPSTVSSTTAVGTPTIFSTQNWGVQWGTAVSGSRPKPAGVASTFFYLRSYGYIIPSVTGKYTIGLNNDGGANLFIGTQQIVNNLAAAQLANNTTAYTQSGTILLTAGVYYPFVLEWQHSNAAQYECQLLWTPPLGSVQVVPFLNFSSVLGTTNTLVTDAWWNGTETLWYPSGNGTSDPSSSISMPPKGSIPPALNGAFSYTSTATSVTWSWTTLTIYRADGSTTIIGSGSITESSLTAATTYYYYPYYDEVSNSLTWVAGSGYGTDGISFTAAQRTANGNQYTQTQNLQSHVPLSTGPMTLATPASGSGGGSGGGSGSCLRSTMLVDERTKGIIPAFAVCVGDHLRNRTGWVKVLFSQIRKQDIFIRVNVNGHAVEVTPSHPFECMDENCSALTGVRAGCLSLTHQLYTVDGADFVQALQVVKVLDGEKMVITTDGDHTFFSGVAFPYILTHNLLAPS